MSNRHHYDTRSLAYAIAADADVDHRPVLAWLRGTATLPRGSVGERILRVATTLGAGPPVPPPAAAQDTGRDTVRTANEDRPLTTSD